MNCAPYKIQLSTNLDGLDLNTTEWSILALDKLGYDTIKTHVGYRYNANEDKHVNTKASGKTWIPWFVSGPTGTVVCTPFGLTNMVTSSVVYTAVYNI